MLDPFGIVSRVKINADYRMLFPFPLKRINGKGGLPPYGAEQFPPTLKKCPQS
jgi:hypothetical protein